MKIISSSDNKTVKLVKKLHDKKTRDRDNSFLVEGEKLVIEAINQGATFSTIIFRGEKIEKLQIPDNVDTVIMTEELFDDIADTVTPQSIMAIVQKPRVKNIVEDESVNKGYIVLDSLQDPGNVGTIIRTAEAAGFRGVIAVKGTADPFSQKVVRAAAGSIFRIPIIMMDSPEETLKYLATNEVKPIICDAYGEKKHTDFDLRGNTAIIVGNEGNGISDYFIDNIEDRISIEMAENSESLNVAIAAAILIFEKKRQEEAIGD